MQLRLKDQTSQTAAAADLLIGQEKRYRHCALGGEARQATLFRNGLGSGDARLIDMGPGWPTPKPSRSGTTAPERGLAEEQFCLWKWRPARARPTSCVYIKTLPELDRRYGLTKFIVVVPSVAMARAS